MTMSHTLQLRQALECSACGALISPAYPGAVPRDPLTGRVHAATCVELDICPVCHTQHDHLDDRTLARIVLYLKNRPRARRATGAA